LRDGWRALLLEFGLMECSNEDPKK